MTTADLEGLGMVPTQVPLRRQAAGAAEQFDEGGDPPCWAHLFDDESTSSASRPRYPSTCGPFTDGAGTEAADDTR